MSVTNDLRKIQNKNNSIICLGLDLDPKKMPQEFISSPKSMFDFAARIIDTTSDKVCAYKPNIAFYEALGADGLSLLRMIIKRIPDEIPVIVDAKRGDIGNTAAQYADALYNGFGADWVTLSPYMGYDSLRPFLEYKDRGIFVLCLTSNPGSKDFQMLPVEGGGKMLYTVVAEKVAYWNKDNNCGIVVGATQPEPLKELRAIAGEMPILIPGVGAQGGSLEKAVRFGTENFRKPAIVNVSRSVLYASRDANDFAQKARAELEKLNSIVDSQRTGGGKDNRDASGAPNESQNNQQGQPEHAGAPQDEGGGKSHQSNS